MKPQPGEDAENKVAMDDAVEPGTSQPEDPEHRLLVEPVGYRVDTGSGEAHTSLDGEFGNASVRSGDGNDFVQQFLSGHPGPDKRLEKILMDEARAEMTKRDAPGKGSRTPRRAR